MSRSLVSIAAAAALATGAATANESLAEAVKAGHIKGQLRFFYVDRNYDGLVTIHRSALAAGGYFGYETGAWKGLSAGAAFYMTHNFGIHADNLPGEVQDPTLQKRDGSGYTMLGEAYLKYRYEETTFVGGRQRFNSPMMGLDDARMIPNLFEAYLVRNESLADTTLTLAHVTKMAQGTFGNVYKGGGLGATAGYTYLSPADYETKMGVGDPTGRFLNMGRYAVGESNDGVTVLSAVYTGFERVKLQAWDYYAWDMLNTLYLQGDVSWACLINSEVTMHAAVQYIHENDVGDDLVTQAIGDKTVVDGIESDYIGLKLGASYGPLSGYFAYSSTFSDDKNNPLGSSILSMWGGMPAFTQGMVTRHQFFADTDAWKVAGTYRFDDLGVNANATLYYASFDVGEANPYNTGTSWTASESGVDVKYYPQSIKNLQLRFRANFPRDFLVKKSASPDNVDWDEYRFIVNYNF